MTKRPTTETLKAARAWCAREFKKRRKPFDGHPSHLAASVLEAASVKFELGDSGVEGFCNAAGTNGVSYLNYGDPHDPTICALSTPYGIRFTYAAGGWAPYAGERSPSGSRRGFVRGVDGYIYKIG